MSVLHLCLAALVSGLMALERKAFLQAMLSRPLVAGTIVGLLLGHPVEGVLAGAALELFFLGAVNLGAALPDNELFASVAASACAGALASKLVLPRVPALACAVLVALPAAKLGKAIDRLSEQFNGWVVGRVSCAGGPRQIRAHLRHNFYGMWIPFLAAAAICLAGAAVGWQVLPPLAVRAPAALPRALSAAWVAFLVVAAASAARTARSARALLWATLSAALAVLIQVSGLWRAA